MRRLAVPAIAGQIRILSCNFSSYFQRRFQLFYPNGNASFFILPVIRSRRRFPQSIPQLDHWTFLARYWIFKSQVHQNKTRETGGREYLTPRRYFLDTTETVPPLASGRYIALRRTEPHFSSLRSPLAFSERNQQNSFHAFGEHILLGCRSLEPTQRVRHYYKCFHQPFPAGWLRRLKLFRQVAGLTAVPGDCQVLIHERKSISING